MNANAIIIGAGNVGCGATKVKPEFIGRPNPEMVQAFSKRLNVSRDEVAIVGDRLNPDIRMGQEHGTLSILVSSQCH